MMVVDKLKKYAHFIPVMSIYKEINIANIFMRENFRFHGITKSIF